MSSSRQFAIMSLHAGQKMITKCVPFIYRILQYRELTVERALRMCIFDQYQITIL